MANNNCSRRCRCSAAAVIAAIIIGVLTAFFQITGVISVTTAFLWVVFGIGVFYLAALVLAPSLRAEREPQSCLCPALNLLLIALLGTIALALVLLAVGIVATSVVSAILVGLLLFFFTLTLTASACVVRHLGDCESFTVV